MKEKISEKIKRMAVKQAEDFGKNSKPEDVENVEKNMDAMNRGPLKKVWGKVKAIWSAFCSPQTPTSVKVLLIGALIYMVMPVDIIPDVMFPVGLIDDAAVIAFIYFQFKDIIERAIPTITKQAEKVLDAVDSKVNKISEDLINQTIGQMFNQFCKKFALNSAIKLLLFCVALLLLMIADQRFPAIQYIASCLILLIAIWAAITFVKNFVLFLRMAFRFVPEYKKIVEREKDNEANAIAKNKAYSKLKFSDRIAEAAYMAFGKPYFVEKNRKTAKFISFVFCSWNEGKLPSIVPDKKKLALQIWGVVKIRLIIFLSAFAGYLLIYTFLIKGLLLQTVTDYSFMQLLLYPFTSAFMFLF